MQILKTRQELEDIFVDSTATVGYVTINRKDDNSTLHPGHEYLIDYCNSNFDYTVVGFWDTVDLIYNIYGNAYFANEVGLPWDSTGCIAWCESHGVDYVVVPDEGYAAQYLQQIGLDTSSIIPYKMVDTIWAQNNYLQYEPTENDASLFNSTLRAKVVVMLQNYKQHFNNTFVASWKDGFPRFTIQHYVNNYTPENFILLDPIKTPDGLYYSTSYYLFTEAQKDIIKQFETVVDSVGYDDTTALISALNALDTGVGFSVRRIDITYGGVVGEANDFINIQYSMGSYPDGYPIYKKGVR